MKQTSKFASYVAVISLVVQLFAGASPALAATTEGDTTSPNMGSINAKTVSAWYGIPISQSNWQEDNDPYFSWSAPADPSGIKGYWYNLDGGEQVFTTSRNVLYPNNSIADGQHTLGVIAEDNAGNKSGTVGTFAIWVDTTAPTSQTIIDSSYVGPSTYNASTIKGIASDLGSGVKKVSLLVQRDDGRYWSRLLNTWVSWNPLFDINANGTDNWQYSTLIPANKLGNGRTYTITPSATDNYGLFGHGAQGTADSFVWDNDLPSITLPANITTEANSLGGANVTFTGIQATDTTSDIFDAQCSHLSGDLFPLGATTVSCWATDNAGNTSSGTFTVTVVDTTAPDVTLNGDASVTIEYGDNYSEPGANWADIADGSGTVSDIVGTVDNMAVGDYSLDYSYTDTSGNTSTAQRVVHVAPRKITVAANDVSKIAGSSDPTITYRITNGTLVGDDKFTGSLVRVAGESAGSYLINLGSLKLNDNYKLTFTGGIFTISPSPAVVPLNTGLNTGTDTAVLGAQTTDDGDKTDDTDVKGTSDTNKSDNKPEPGFLESSWLGVYNWIWLLLAAATVFGGVWWLLGYRRQGEE